LGSISISIQYYYNKDWVSPNQARVFGPKHHNNLLTTKILA